MSINLLGYFAGILVVISLLPQVIKSWRTKSAKDISFERYIVYIAGLILWITYAVIIKNGPVAVMNSIGLVLASMILYLKLKYGKRKMKKFDAVAFANTFALIDLVLHPAFHLWGWIAPRSYELVMSEFVIGLRLNVAERFSPKFFVFWFFEAAAMWLLGYAVATIYNRLSR